MRDLWFVAAKENVATYHMNLSVSYYTGECLMVEMVRMRMMKKNMRHVLAKWYQYW